MVVQLEEIGIDGNERAERKSAAPGQKETARERVERMLRESPYFKELSDDRRLASSGHTSAIAGGENQGAELQQPKRNRP